MHERWDDPEINRRVVKALLVLSPFLFGGGYLIAAMQGARQPTALLIASLGLAMGLGTAGAIHWLRSRAVIAFGAVAALVMLLSALIRS